MESLISLLQKEIDCLEREISALRILKNDKEDKVDDLKLLFNRIKQENFISSVAKPVKLGKERKLSDETARSNTLSLSTKACSYISCDEYNASSEYKLIDVEYDKSCSLVDNCTLTKMFSYWNENINKINQ